MLFSLEMDLSSSIEFVVQLSVICLFTTMLIGFVIKKFLQIMVKG